MQDEKAARRAELDRQLPNLWNAIVDATRSEEAFWLGEILLSEIVKETGYKGSATMTQHGSDLICKTCGGELVCRCGQTLPSHNWPCTHGGCLFECPKCETAQSHAAAL